MKNFNAAFADVVLTPSDKKGPECPFCVTASRTLDEFPEFATYVVMQMRKGEDYAMIFLFHFLVELYEKGYDDGVASCKNNAEVEELNRMMGVENGESDTRP